MFRVFKTDNVNKAAGKMLSDPNDQRINLFQHHGGRGDLQAAIKISGSPTGYLDNDLNRQFSQGYSFSGNPVAREAGLRDPSFEDPRFERLTRGLNAPNTINDMQVLGALSDGEIPF